MLIVSDPDAADSDVAAVAVDGPAVLLRTIDAVGIGKDIVHIDGTYRVVSAYCHMIDIV